MPQAAHMAPTCDTIRPLTPQASSIQRPLPLPYLLMHVTQADPLPEPKHMHAQFNIFGATFADAITDSDARARAQGFDPAVVYVHSDDVHNFLLDLKFKLREQATSAREAAEVAAAQDAAAAAAEAEQQQHEQRRGQPQEGQQEGEAQPGDDPDASRVEPGGGLDAMEEEQQEEEEAEEGGHSNSDGSGSHASPP